MAWGSGNCKIKLFLLIKKTWMLGTINTDFQLAESQMDTVNAQYIVLHLSLSQIIIYIQRQSNTDCATHHIDSDGTFESRGSHGPDAVQVHQWVVTQHRLDLFCCSFLFEYFFFFFYPCLLAQFKKTSSKCLSLHLCVEVIVSVFPWDILFVILFTSETNQNIYKFVGSLKKLNSSF